MVVTLALQAGNMVSSFATQKQRKYMAVGSDPTSSESFGSSESLLCIPWLLSSVRQGVLQQVNSKQLVHEDAKHVIQLTSATFKEFVGSNDNVMVHFVSSLERRQGETPQPVESRTQSTTVAQFSVLPP